MPGLELSIGSADSGEKEVWSSIIIYLMRSLDLEREREQIGRERGIIDWAHWIEALGGWCRL